jgi:hypothetical protein
MHRCACSRSHCRYLSLTHLQDKDQCIDLGRPAIDVTMAPDSITALRDIIKPCPSLRTRCTTSLKLAAINKEDAHHSTSYLHHRGASPKTMPSWGRMTPTTPPLSDLGYPNLGFPQKQLEWSRSRPQWRCLRQWEWAECSEEGSFVRSILLEEGRW